MLLRGKSVLNQKTELQRAMQKHQEHKVKKEVELQRQMNKTAFERVIEERARKLESVSFVLVTLKTKKKLDIYVTLL